MQSPGEWDGENANLGGHRRATIKTSYQLPATRYFFFAPTIDLL